MWPLDQLIMILLWCTGRETIRFMQRNEGFYNGRVKHREPVESGFAVS